MALSARCVDTIGRHGIFASNSDLLNGFVLLISPSHLASIFLFNLWQKCIWDICHDTPEVDLS